MQRWPWLLVCLSLGLRLALIGGESLWYDETFTAWLAALPPEKIVFATLGDVHPPLWYFLESLITQPLGNSEFVLRLPSAIFSSLASLELYRLVKSLSGQRAAVYAGIAGAIAPGQIAYGQEARMYGLLAWLVLFALNAALDRNYWRLTPTLALALWTHNLAPVYAFVIGLAALFRGGKKAVIPLALSGGAWLPWLLPLVNQIGNVSDGFWIPSQGIGTVLYYFYFTTFGVRVPLWFQVHSALFAFGATLIALYLVRHDIKRLAPVIALALAPPTLVYLASVTWRPVFLHRALIPAGLGLLALWGIALSKLNGRKLRSALGVTIPLALVALVSYYFPDQADQPVENGNIDEFLTTIRAEYRPGDVVYHVSLASLITTSYYLPDLDHFLLPQANDLSQSLTEETKAIMGIKQAPINALARRYDRAWLLHVDNPTTADFEVRAAERIADTYPVIMRYTAHESEMVKFYVLLLEL